MEQGSAQPAEDEEEDGEVANAPTSDGAEGTGAAAGVGEGESEKQGEAGEKQVGCEPDAGLREDCAREAKGARPPCLSISARRPQ